MRKLLVPVKLTPPAISPVEGVAPDVEVEQTPSEIIKGRDPQLEKAIEIALEELKKNPQVEPTRPPYPVKVKN